MTLSLVSLILEDINLSLLAQDIWLYKKKTNNILHFISPIVWYLISGKTLQLIGLGGYGV